MKEIQDHIRLQAAFLRAESMRYYRFHPHNSARSELTHQEIKVDGALAVNDNSEVSIDSNTRSCRIEDSQINAADAQMLSR